MRGKLHDGCPGQVARAAMRHRCSVDLGHSEVFFGDAAHANLIAEADLHADAFIVDKDPLAGLRIDIGGKRLEEEASPTFAPALEVANDNPFDCHTLALKGSFVGGAMNSRDEGGRISSAAAIAIAIAIAIAVAVTAAEAEGLPDVGLSEGGSLFGSPAEV